MSFYVNVVLENDGFLQIGNQLASKLTQGDDENWQLLDLLLIVVVKIRMHLIAFGEQSVVLQVGSNEAGSQGLQVRVHKAI